MSIRTAVLKWLGIDGFDPFSLELRVEGLAKSQDSTVRILSDRISALESAQSPHSPFEADSLRDHR